MKFTDLAKVLPAYLRSGVSLELISAPGRGKSEFVRQMLGVMSEKSGAPWGFATMFLATQNPTDLSGLLFKGAMQDAKGNTIAIADPTLPTWMVTEDGRPVWEYENGILFLDEYGQGDSETKRASAELLLNRRLGKWELPRGWSVIAASNRANDRSGVTKSFDFVINRRGEIHIDDDVDGWVDWANKAGVHPVLVAFAATNPQVVFSDGVPDKQGPWCTPRSLVMLDRVFAELAPGADVPPVDGVALEVAGGIIGQAAAAQLVATVRLAKELPAFRDIITDPRGTRLPSADRPDAQMLVCFNLAQRVDEGTFEPVMWYIDRMPKEYAMTFVKAAVHRDPNLVNTSTFNTWAIDNQSILNAIF